MKPCVFLFILLKTTLPVVIADPSTQAHQFETGPKVGEAAPDFTLKTLDGKSITGSNIWSQKPTVLITGSYTCPIFRGHISQLKRLLTEFGDRVNFLLLYTLEAHPKGDPSPYRGVEWVTPANEEEGLLIPQPKTMEERLTVAQKCVDAFQLKLPVIIDSMENTTWKAYGGAPNAAYLINTDGKVLLHQGWFDGQTLYQAISSLSH